MAAYLLGESSARFLRSLQQGRAPASATGETRLVRAMSIQGDDYALPYTVRWATSVGGWIVWLPGDCLIVDAQPVDSAADLESAGGDYPHGWYKLGIPEDAESVYLNVTVAAGDNGEIDTSVAFSSSASVDDGVLSIVVANMSGKSVKQLVDSALVIGGTGVRSLNDLRGDLELVGDETRPLVIDGARKYIGVRTDKSRPGKIMLGFADDVSDPSDEEGYCNEISHDSASGEPGNEISDEGEIDGGGGGGAGGIGGNAISRWPCKKN